MVHITCLRYFGVTISKLSLSNSQKSMIQKSWKAPSANLGDSGVAILYNYFKRYPDSMKYFDKFKDIPLEELKKNPDFRNHAKKIMKIFDKSVKVLNTSMERAELQTIWHKMGVDHKIRKIPKSAFPELKLVVLDTLKLDDDHTKAWDIFIDDAFKIMYQKY